VENARKLYFVVKGLSRVLGDMCGPVGGSLALEEAVLIALIKQIIGPLGIWLI
jgi:hypothetical protein